MLGSKPVGLVVVWCTASLCIVFLLAGSASAQNMTADQLAAEAKKMKEKIVKIGQSHDVTIVRRDGKEFYGTISSIEEDLVLIREVDLKTNIEINYQQITKVSKGYGESRSWNGKRIPPKKHRLGLILGAAAIIIPVVIVVVSMRKND